MQVPKNRSACFRNKTANLSFAYCLSILIQFGRIVTE